MLSKWYRPYEIARLSCLLLAAPSALAQPRPAWVDPPVDLSRLQDPPPIAANPEEPTPAPIKTGPDLELRYIQSDQDSPPRIHSAQEARPEPTARVRSTQPALQTASESTRQSDRVRTARDLAIRYLDVWSAPNPVALGSASAFYGSSVVFHGQWRSFASVLAEKRRFAERWPERSYRYRPTTMRVACGAQMPHCTVRSLFDFSASNPRRGRRSLGTGEHELVVSFAGGRPAIAIENSRVLQRGGITRR
jgi:hypothetical protein